MTAKPPGSRDKITPTTKRRRTERRPHGWFVVQGTNKMNEMIKEDELRGFAF